MANDFQINRGDTTTINVLVTDSLGAPYDLTGATLYLSAKDDLSDAEYTFTTDSTPSGSITITPPESDGAAVAKILPEHTLALSNSKVTKLVWGMQLILNGDVTTIASGTFQVVPVVTYGGA